MVYNKWVMTSDFKSILNSQMPIGNSSNKLKRSLPVEQVDDLANVLADDYNNAAFRQWYCGVIYEFGLAKVTEWQRRSKEGREPGRLFSMYVKDARKYSKDRRET